MAELFRTTLSLKIVAASRPDDAGRLTPLAEHDAAPGPQFGNPGGLTAVRFDIGNTTAIGTTGNFTNQDVNALISGSAWDVTNITFSFPTKGAYYGAGYGDGEPTSGFQKLDAAQKGVVRDSLDLISQYTGLTFTEVTESSSVHANLRFAGSDVPSTSWAYYPWTSTEAGDVWLGNIKDTDPVKAGYAMNTIMHEIGHAMGLKHGHSDDGEHGVLPANHNSTEWSIMTYHSYIGADFFYRNGDGDGNQSYMINDIAALQYLYGANYNINKGDTVYTWSPTTGETFINGSGEDPSVKNVIYRSIWDGGGKDTYDLSNYTSSMTIDLNPGEWSTFDSAQLADLDASNPGLHFAHGNVANAHLYNKSGKSLIENAIGGSGHDKITGNVNSNQLTGNAGKDVLTGGKGADTLNGGAGRDALIGGKGNDVYDFDHISDSAVGAEDLIKDLKTGDIIDLAGIDARVGKPGDQAFVIVDAFHNKRGELLISFDGTNTLIEMDTDGDGVANGAILIKGDHTDFTGFVL